MPDQRMPDKRLTAIARDMLAWAESTPYDPARPETHQVQLASGPRLTCYVLADRYHLRIERQYRELELKESSIVRAVFHVPRACHAQACESGNGYRGIEFVWPVHPEEKDEDPDPRPGLYQRDLL